METLLDGRYRLGEEISRGAVGAVRRATDTLTGEPVAVKTLRPEAATQPEMVAAFIAEAEILAGVAHPSIVRARDFVTTDDRYALVMEFVAGEDLRRRVRRAGPVPPAVAADIVLQVAEALAYLHGRGVVHGDVKPGNVLVPADGGRVRLADFGVARWLADDGRDRPLQATPEYAAPEVVAGAMPEPAADVYALGIVLFELLCGRSPFRGGSPGQVLNRHGRCAPVPPPGLPPVVWPLIEDCLAGRPEDRPGAATLAGRLRGVEPALDGVPALGPLTPQQVTWWPRPHGATAAVARVSWVPLTVAPVSPASAYLGRMVAIPVAQVSPPSIPVRTVETPPPAVPAPPPAVPAVPPPVVPVPAVPAVPVPAVPVVPVPAVPAVRRRLRQLVTAGLAAAGLAVVVAASGFLLISAAAPEDRGRPEAIVDTPATTPAGRPGTDTTPGPGPDGAGPDPGAGRAGVPGVGDMLIGPDTGGLPGIGDPLPTP